MASKQRGVCGRCDEDYEPYLLLFLRGTCWMELLQKREEYGWLCPDCLDEVTPCSDYAIADSTELSDKR